MRLPSISRGCFILVLKKSGVSVLNSGHSVTRIQQSASLKQSTAEEA